MRHLILGNGAAGMTAAQKLREINNDDEITVVTYESDTAYAKIMLPDYIGGSKQREKLILRDTYYYKTAKIDLLRECNVESIDIVTKSVRLNCKKQLEYDKLLIATGASQFIPKIEGLKDGDFFTLNSLSDADKIRQEAKSGKSAVIVGAGLTGIEISLALKKSGMNVTIIDREKGLLCNQLDAYSSKVLEDALKSKDIRIIQGNTVKKVLCEEEKKVFLEDNTMLFFDMLIISSGTRPNIKQARDAGIECKKGILVDEYSRTSVKDVFAAGDVSEFSNGAKDGYATGYIWPNAMAQGKSAAFNMAGIEQPFLYTDVKFNPLQLRDIPFISAGLISPKDENTEVLTKHEINDYRRIILIENVVKGFVLFGNAKLFAEYLKLFRTQTDISGLKGNLL
ncbi:MAG: FAD-dependent oxidoreductase [Clostridia bacterium]|jgi:nitrite reductase (NADH) large subunit